MAGGYAGRALRETAGSAILPAKTIGTCGEQFFAYRALEEGLHVAQPLGDNLPYDLLVDTGKNIHRIQVKTSITEDVGNAAKIRRHRYSFYLKHGAKSEVYESGVIDFFALILLPLHTIYIVPTEIIAGRTKCSAYPGNPNSLGRLEAYKEAWHLIQIGDEIGAFHEFPQQVLVTLGTWMPAMQHADVFRYRP